MSFSVLTVDDDPVLLRLLAIMIDCDERLRLAGTATNGAAALRTAKSSCPDAILCDVVMPVMGGMEVLPALRRVCPDAVIALYTSSTEETLGAERLGADAVFDKTTDLTRVLDELAALCGIRG